jgi:REP element-mobilizing transposase RayT
VCADRQFNFKTQNFLEKSDPLGFIKFWSDGYFVSSVGKHGNEDTIREYVKEQVMRNNQYKRLIKQQLTLF